MRNVLLTLVCLCSLSASAQRLEVLLNKNWKFTKGDIANASAVNFNDSQWESVTIPHDWAIFGPFDRANDLQVVQVLQNGETEPSEKTGRSGGLPYAGVG